MLRAHLLDVSFPWMQFGDSLSGYPILIGAADLVGSRGLSFWLVAANAFIAMSFLALRARGWRAARGPALALLITLAGPVGYSVVRWQTLDIRTAARVGVVQPNVPQHLRDLDPVASTDSALRSTETLTSPWVGRERMDLVIFPETMLTATVLDPLPSYPHRGWPQAHQWAEGLGTTLEAEVLVGGRGGDDVGPEEYQPFNSAYHFRPGDGLVNRYDKRFVVPMVERVPFIPPRWLSLIPYTGRLGVGDCSRQPRS